jgi:hypothetical protein
MKRKDLGLPLSPGASGAPGLLEARAMIRRTVRRCVFLNPGTAQKRRALGTPARGRGMGREVAG